jgi:hypothetical protein
MRAIVTPGASGKITFCGNWLFVTDRRRSCTTVGSPVKARSTRATNPFPMMKARTAWVREHNPVVQPGADWPEGI